MDERIQLLRELAARRGITDSYHDVTNVEHVTTDEVRAEVLEACGYDVRTAEALRREIQQMDDAPWRRLIAPVLVKLPAELSGGIRMQVPGGIPKSIEMLLLPEAGDPLHASADPALLLEIGEKTIGGQLYKRYALPFPWQLEIGYYGLTVTVETDTTKLIQETRLIVCPEQAYLPDWYRNNERIAGIGISLYGLRTGQNMGVGDTGDLRDFISWAADTLGIEFIGLNPLHAIFNRQPYNASPYLPNSRYFRNFIYLDLCQIEDFNSSKEAQTLLASPDIQTRLSRLRGTETVAYEDVTALKLELLEAAFSHFMKEGIQRSDFESYLESEGDFIDHYATFCAIDEEMGRTKPGTWSWTQWPETLRDPRGEGVREFKRDHADRILFFKYLQWHLDRQLAAAANCAREHGLRVGLYMDLALAIDRHGADFWAYRHLFVESAKTGAPPDPLAPQGQDWQFPPPDRDHYRADAYRLFSEKIRRNCRYAGALRLDHVMRLLRLFWIPAGKTAADGAYVIDYHDDLLKIVCLESVLNHTIIIGEDLGTVPDWIREALSKHGILSYRVFHFERHPDGSYKRPEEYPRLGLATLSTHDLATLCGFWEERDLFRRRQAGLIRSEEDLNRAREDRHREKYRIADTLGIPNDAPPQTARNKISEFLASTPSALMLLNQEDLFLECEQQNMPGTTTEHLNWARKMKYQIEELRKNPEVIEGCRAFKEILRNSGRARG